MLHAADVKAEKFLKKCNKVESILWTEAVDEELICPLVLNK